MSSSRGTKSKFLYIFVPIIGALVTGLVSSLPWLYDRFVVQEFRLSYKVETPIPMTQDGVAKFIQIVSVINDGRAPLSGLVASLPSAETISVQGQGIPFLINESRLVVETLLPGEDIRATVITLGDGLKDDISVRSNEVSGKIRLETPSSNSVVFTILFSMAGSILAGAIAMLYFRSWSRVRADDPNLILLVSSVFKISVLMDIIWDVRSSMKYRGAAEVILNEVIDGQCSDSHVKAMISLCVDPNQSERDRYEISYYISRLVGKDADLINKKLSDNLVARSSSREDLFERVWFVKDSELSDLIG